MRPHDPEQACAGEGPGSADPDAGAPAPQPEASPDPEPSAETDPAPAQEPGAGPAAGAASESRPRSRPSVPGHSDAPWTRFIFQGSFGAGSAGLGTEKAAGIWKTPAAYIGRRPGVSGPQRAAFVRELEEVLCSDRPPPLKKITQEDVEVMLTLLEERERDLSTAARIGQSLVKQNSALMEENSKLEAMLGSARKEILHLRHQVSLRDDLLQLYSDSDQQCDYSHDTPKPIPLKESQHHCPQLEALQQKLRLLEEENNQLREEATQLDNLEEEEQMLILECVEQFSEASQQMAELSEVLALRMENHDRQQREVSQLRAQVVKLQQRCQSYGAETEELQQQLASEKEIQMQLQEEEKYMECGGMLIEAQEEVKTLRQQAQVSTGSVVHSTYTMPLDALPGFQEALAEELRTSIRRIVSDPLFFMERRNYERMARKTSNLGWPSDLKLFRVGTKAFPSVSLSRYEQCYREERQQQQQRFEATEGQTPAEDFVPAEDFATRSNVVSSAVEASGLGPSHLDMKYVLQQLASWQDAHCRRQLRQKMLQKGSPTLQQWQQQAKTNMGGGIVEQRPGVPTQDFRRLEEDRANNPPRAWEEEGPSGAT
uniref:Huntingtin associated protein 1 n=1 Tax=Loxodonta africana TaxID=9785 RepID=G3T1F8_LOXAF